MGISFSFYPRVSLLFLIFLLYTKGEEGCRIFQEWLVIRRGV